MVLRTLKVFTDLEAVAGRAAALDGALVSQPQVFETIARALNEYMDSRLLAEAYGVHEMAKRVAERTPLTYPQAVGLVIRQGDAWQIAKSTLDRLPVEED